MRLLAACSLGGAGHLNPMLPFLLAARRGGADILIVGPPAMQQMVEQSGFPFQPGGEPSERDVAPIRERLPLAPAGEAAILGNRELFARLATAAMLPVMEQMVPEWHADLVLRDPCEYASAVCAHRLGVPTAQVGISLATVEENSITVAAPALEAHRTGLVDELRATPYLSRFPASLDPSAFPATIRYHDPPMAPVQRLPDWWGGSDAPLVYLTFGTVLGYMSLAAGVYRAAIKGVSGLDVRVLLTVGRRFDAARLGSIPPNVHVEGWVDQDRVVSEADLVVCHGGSGTLFGALAAGVPVVAVPVFADQFENARRLVASGAGLTVATEWTGNGPSRRVVDEQEAPRITRAITRALEDPSYRREACRLAEETAASRTVDQVLAGLVSDSAGKSGA